MSQSTGPDQRSRGGRQGRRGRGRGRGGRGRGLNNDGRGKTTGNQNHRNNNTWEKTTSNKKNTATIGAYQFCSQEEYEERQELKQVHELEATRETCTLPQAQRILDPRLAVSKYKRSAAGTTHTTKSPATLETTIKHLQHICATRQATPDHPPVGNIQNVAEFLVDRLRACQADATRLATTGVSEMWHVHLVRMLLWIRYWTYTDDLQQQSWMQRTIHTMISTAIGAYWGTRQENEQVTGGVIQLDDEMLCWSVLLQLSQLQQESVVPCYNSILLEYAKYVRTDSSEYPLWHKALSLASHLVRQEYYGAWKNLGLPVLFKCCIEPALFRWRYRMVQQYNKSFAKQERVSDLPRLLGIQQVDWSLEYAQEFALPVERNETEIAVVVKQVLMDDVPPTTQSKTSRRDHVWVLGEHYTVEEPMGISSTCIEQLLQKGRIE
jgi:hypothetical protein